MLYTEMWSLVVLFALAANAAVVPGGRQAGPQIAKRANTAYQNDLYLKQARDAEAVRNPGWTAMGCRTDAPAPYRSLVNLLASWDNMTLPICMNECFSRSYTYGGVQWGSECWCGNTMNTGTYRGWGDAYIKYGDPYGTLVPYSECQSFPCAGDKSTACGNNWRNNVFMVADRAQASANIQASASASAYSTSASMYSASAAVYSASASAYSSKANAFSASASASAYSSSAIEYSRSASTYSASLSAYSSNANAYSAAQATISASLSAYSASVNASLSASASRFSQSSLAQYSASASAYSANVAAYSQSASAAAYSSSTDAAARASASAYSANAAAYSQSASAAAYSSSADAAARASASAYSSAASAYSASVDGVAQASLAAYSNNVYSASSAAAYSQSASAAAASASASAAAAKAAETSIPDTWVVPRTVCVAEGTTGRAMTGASFAAPDMSAGQCIKLCNDAGFVLAGTQYSQECTCSNILSNGASLDKPSTDCNMKCGGSDQICGGPNAITLYVKQSALADLSDDFTSKPIAFTNGWQVAPSDCIAEGTSGRALPDASFADANMTPSMCMEFCGAKKFQYAGVEYGNECHCSGSLQNGASLEKKAQCSMTCAGNKSIYCGGPGALNLFVNPSIGEDLTQAAASASKAAADAQNSNAAALQAKLPTGWTAAATTCIEEVSGRALSGASTAGDDMTVDKCATFCQSKGFTLAGLEFGGECYCANSLSNGASLDRKSSACTMQCNGDSTQICGGPNGISLFTGPATAPTVSTSGPQLATDLPAGWSAASTNCIQEVSGRALTGHSEAADDMTISKCISICGNRGFKLAAVEFGAECFCGNSLVNGASLDLVSGQCNMPCAGDSKVLCGGPNALQLYTNPDAVAGPAPSPTASAAPAGPTPETDLPAGWQAASSTCIQEVPGRTLTGYATTTDDMTIPKCLAICENMGFFYAAVEYGGECHCGNGFSNGGSLDKVSNQCNMGCSGKPSTLCGGPDALQLYTNPSLDPSTRSHNGFSYGGCIMEVPGRALNATSLATDDMTLDKCTGFCKDSGYKMAGLEYGSECYCGNSLVGGATKDSLSYECKMPCAGNSAEMCGGPDAINLYVMQ